MQIQKGLFYLRALTSDPQELKQIKSTIQEIEVKIENSFKKALSSYPSSTFKEKELLLNYYNDWQRLKDIHLQISPLKSSFQPTDVNIKVFQFLKSLGEKYNLFAYPDLYLRTLAQVSLLGLPNLIEALEELRAIGSVAAERSYILAEDKKIFIKNFQSLYGYQEVLRWTLSNIQFPRETLIAFENSFKLLEEFMNYSESLLLYNFKGEFALTGYGYFKLATLCIDSFYNLHSSIFEEYLKQLEAKREKLAKDWFLGFFFLSLVMASICLFFYLTYHRLAKRLSRIAYESQKIASGDLSARITPDYDDELGRVVKLLNASLDELEMRLKEIYFLHYHDPITKAPNREKLLEELKKRKIVNLLLVDIDNFKALNTLYGEEIGNKVLKYITQKLKEIFKTEVYRVGPDEFALILPEEEIKKIIPKAEALLLMAAKEPLYYQDLEIFFHLRGALITECLKPEYVLPLAYDLLKETKHRNNVIDCLNKPPLDRDAVYKENLLIMKKIRSAIDDKRIVPYYQPVFENKTKEIVKVEALMRIRDKNGEILSPSKFLPVAKKTGYYPQLTLRMFEEVQNHLPLLPWSVSLNLSFLDLLNQETYQGLLSLIKKISQTLQSKSKLVLELLETEEIEFYEEIIPLLFELKKEGVLLAIDDFGTGYSNLQRLIKLEVDFIKIDTSIIKTLPEGEKAKNLVKAIVNFAKAAGIKTIAEFVSDERIFKWVCELGVDYSQGYYFSPPLTFEELIRFTQRTP